MSQLIFPTNPSAAFFTSERCYIIEVLNQTDWPSFSIAQARVEPGTHTQLHALKNINEVYYVLKGYGEMEIDGKIIGLIKPGDAVTIPEAMSQRVKNTGTEDLIFLCICSPRFKVSKYENLEDL